MVPPFVSTSTNLPHDRMEGPLMVPPDRGQILGRAAWKTRYVVCGKRESSASGPQTPSSSKARQPLRITSDEVYLSLYKNKGDSDSVYQCAVSHITDCQVQMIAHRKQGPILPTLVITVSDRERKRRSSRAANLIGGNKESLSSALTLWLRTTPEDKQSLLHEWGRFIMARKLPMSPDSPASPTFMNPFGARNEVVRPPTGNTSGRLPMHHKSSIATQSSRERAVTYSSDSPSLRSKASDLSTPSSTMPAYTISNSYSQGQGQVFSPAASDLPSPATTTTLDEYRNDSGESWAVPKAPATNTSSPIRRRESLDKRPSAVDSSSPPVPGETILDRAFNMRMVPGSERMIPGEEKLSSLARFEALMREADVKRRDKEHRRQVEEQMAMRSTFNSDSTDEDEDFDEMAVFHNHNDDTRHHEQQPLQQSHWSASPVNVASSVPTTATFSQRHTLISPAAQRALNFITSRHESGGLVNSSTSPSLGLHSDSASHRPRTGYSGRRRPTISSRTHSQPHSFFQQNVVGEAPPLGPSAIPKQPSTKSRPQTTIADRRQSETRINYRSSKSVATIMKNCSSGSGNYTMSTATKPKMGLTGATAVTAPTSPNISTSAGADIMPTRRLSFTECDKRISQASSMLIMQSNVTGTSSSDGRASTDTYDLPFDENLVPQQNRHTLVPPPRPSRTWESAATDRGGFRQGMVSMEGGFF
ncbi:hypothetical protein HOO65_040195 [Ceratocystis lukuohia]|uniref:Uncharacterized protein n=1 Tax=Ceratocystis lukuohia TaxID=2019550 RepID=A0ABR4MHU8_9PEZI